MAQHRGKSVFGLWNGIFFISLVRDNRVDDSTVRAIRTTGGARSVPGCMYSDRDSTVA